MQDVDVRESAEVSGGGAIGNSLIDILCAGGTVYNPPANFNFLRDCFGVPFLS